MARTPLASMLQKAYATAHMEMERQNKSGQVRKNSDENSVKKKSGKNKRPSNDKGKMKQQPRIVIVGAGLAGLTSAYRLKQAGISAVVYEASNRVGGRCWTKKDAFKDAQIVERGGELIDTAHTNIRALAGELGLVFDDLIEAETLGTKPFYFFDGAPYSFDDATKDFLHIYPQLQQDLAEVGDTTLYHSFTERGFELDHMSIIDYINEMVPGGIDSRFGQLLAVAYTIEYGADADEQSALNLLYLLGYAQKGPLQLYRESDERLRIKGGNEQLAALLAKELKGQIVLNSELIKVEQNKKNEVRLFFRNGEKEWEVTADKVILTIPFSLLKMIDYKNANFRTLKKMAIEEMGMAVNTKLHLQFTNRFWRELGNNGETFSDTGYQNTFESSRAQKGNSGILVDYTGAETAEKMNPADNKELKKITKGVLDKLEPVLPGSNKNWNGLATIDHWLSNPWSKGSYSFWKVGQYTSFAGIAGEREGNLFFAGEHTSVDFQGYLNGAVETGDRAAQEILDDLFGEKE
ncbi:flavin monoamine oxidase family protein [Niallia endozanthoxylica]|uniref:NAD(P)-binding protein n=1 Tax=Niallia endozanthoxylica TaxID=2036016 RepID=A0A5J5I1U3_9BACI|nr:NAD(P)/FAD-dependent oxidoreductase [Niallia endozanthoxylica]KAA9029905.1 NAD(P)-binding protein [Niallia endozanthoxylica]